MISRISYALGHLRFSVLRVKLNIVKILASFVRLLWGIGKITDLAFSFLAYYIHSFRKAHFKLSFSKKG